MILLVVIVGWVGPSDAQPSSEDGNFCQSRVRTATLDTRGLGAIYCADSTVLAHLLQGAHATARPVFYGAVPATWIGTGIAHRGQDFSVAYRLTVAQGATYGLILGLKRGVGRPRPFVRLSLPSRAQRYVNPSRREAYASFPSGHAGISASIVTSWGLSYPKWYVLGPGVLWATGVSLSRLRLGVHYPSDVLTGAALGVGMAVLVHQVRGHITPHALKARGTEGFAPPPITLHFRF